MELELHPALAAVVEHAGRPAFERDVGARVTAVMAGYGIPGQARVAGSGTAPGHRAARIFVDGRLNPYPPSFLRRLWFGIAPPELHALAFRAGDPQRYPDAWLVACAEGATGDVRDALDELVRCLAEEVVGLRPSRLLTPAPFDVADEHDPLLVVGRALVDRAVTLPDRDALERLLRGHAEAGRSPADALEDLFARLRAPTLEVHLHADLLGLLAPAATAGRVAVDDEGLDAEMVAAMRAVRDHRLLRLGVRLPIELVRSDAVDVGEIRIKLNDRLGPPIPIPEPGEVGVSAPLSALAGHGVAARPLVDAVTGHELAAVPAEHASKTEALGLVPARPGAYLAAAVGRAVSPLAHRLLSIDEVEADLAALEETYPSVVHGVLARFSLTTVTQVMRELVREQVSIHDPWSVLNAMLCFAELPTGDRTPAADTSAPLVDAGLLAFVRAAIGDRVAYDSGVLERVGRVEMPAYVTDETFEDRLAELAESTSTIPEDELSEVREDVWRALGSSPPAEPVLVTAGRVRRELREALALELPGARVLARAELPPEVELRHLGVVASRSG